MFLDLRDPWPSVPPSPPPPEPRRRLLGRRGERVIGVLVGLNLLMLAVAPIAGGSIGRALAAREGLQGDELARRFAAARWHRPLDLETWRGQVAQAAKQGFGLDDGYAHPGICSIGVAVDGDPQSRFCLTASFFAGVRDAEQIDEVGASLVRTAGDRLFRLAFNTPADQ